jgi:hypothetical protein
MHHVGQDLGQFPPHFGSRQLLPQGRVLGL